MAVAATVLAGDKERGMDQRMEQIQGSDLMGRGGEGGE